MSIPGGDVTDWHKDIFPDKLIYIFYINNYTTLCVFCACVVNNKVFIKEFIIKKLIFKFFLLRKLFVFLVDILINWSTYLCVWVNYLMLCFPTMLQIISEEYSTDLYDLGKLSF